MWLLPIRMVLVLTHSLLSLLQSGFFCSTSPATVRNDFHDTSSSNITSSEVFQSCFSHCSSLPTSVVVDWLISHLPKHRLFLRAELSSLPHCSVLTSNQWLAHSRHSPDVGSMSKMLVEHEDFKSWWFSLIELSFNYKCLPKESTLYCHKILISIIRK